MIPDPIERMEARIDELCDEQFLGVPLGSIRCYRCRKIVPFDGCEAISDRPDAPAYCPACLDDYYDDNGIHSIVAAGND